jgi:hypothetical protein
MFVLENDELSVAVLDPQADLDRCGSRYCVGGYLYQITDARHGPLLTGPQYPNPRPNVFHGQGAPDAFFTALGADTAQVGDEVGVIGVGRVRRTSPIEPFYVRHNPEVIEFTPWQVTQDAAAITMQTDQHFQRWQCRITRAITLHGRTLVSRTTVENSGAALPVRWFAHPFFPLTPDRVYCRFSTPITLPETPGYYLNDAGFLCQRENFVWREEGCFVAPEYPKSDASMTILQRHPAVGQVLTSTDFMPDWCPVWSNDVTFSFEPYYIRELGTGESAVWTISYAF